MARMKKQTRQMLTWGAILGGAWLIFKGGQKDGVKKVVEAVEADVATETVKEAAQSGYVMLP